MNEYLPFKIYAVDPKDNNHKSLIGRCFNKGLAKVWIESCITIDNFLLENIDTNQKWFYNSKEKKWND